MFEARNISQCKTAESFHSPHHFGSTKRFRSWPWSIFEILACWPCRQKWRQRWHKCRTTQYAALHEDPGICTWNLPLRYSYANSKFSEEGSLNPRVGSGYVWVQVLGSSLWPSQAGCGTFVSIFHDMLTSSHIRLMCVLEHHASTFALLDPPCIS